MGLEKLSVEWAKYAIKDKKLINYSIFSCINGIIFLMVYFFAVRNEFLLVLSVIFICQSFAYFERNGFILLLKQSNKLLVDTHTL